jgi:hypothetical protein
LAVAILTDHVKDGGHLDAEADKPGRDDICQLASTHNRDIRGEYTIGQWYKRKQSDPKHGLG